MHGPLNWRQNPTARLRRRRQLTPLTKTITDDAIAYSTVSVEFDRVQELQRSISPARMPRRLLTLLRRRAGRPVLAMLRLARDLDDALLDIRFNELEVAVVQFKSAGDPALVLAYDDFMAGNKQTLADARIAVVLARVLKRVDLTSRTLAVMAEPGSCFAGTLAELLFAADRSYMADGQFEGDNRPEATIVLGPLNFGAYPMSNGITRLETRFSVTLKRLKRQRRSQGEALDASAADELGLVHSRLTILTGKTKCGFSWKSAPAFPPMR